MKSKFNKGDMVRTEWGLANIEQVDVKLSAILYLCALCVNSTTKRWVRETDLKACDRYGNPQ
jgi:hypothetical protein